jgi:hypothetical protein
LLSFLPDRHPMHIRLHSFSRSDATAGAITSLQRASKRPPLNSPLIIRVHRQAVNGLERYGNVTDKIGSVPSSSRCLYDRNDEDSLRQVVNCS